MNFQTFTDAFSTRNLNIPLSFAVQSHLTKVYSQLALMMATTALSVYFFMTDRFIFISPTMSALCVFMTLLAFQFTPSSSPKTRQSLLFAFAYFKGTTIAPLVEHSYYVHPSVLVLAFLLASSVFVSFSVSALLTTSRIRIYASSLLSSALAFSFWISMSRFFLGGSAFMYQVELGLGIFIFACYVCLHTQMMVTRIQQSGKSDVLRDVLQLYINLVELFVRILLYLLQSEKEKQKKRKERR